MEGIRTGIQQIINKLQKLNIPAEYQNLVLLASSIEELANIRDHLGEVAKEMERLKAAEKAQQAAVKVEAGANLEKVEAVPIKEAKNDGQ